MSPLARRSTHVAEKRRLGAASLLDAAEALVAAGAPFGELSIDAIAKQAGFSRATFYAYFADKRALALALGERLAAELARGTEPWLRDGTGDVRGTLGELLRTFAAHQGAVRALVEGATYDEDVAALWRRVHEGFRVLARDRLLASNPRITADEADARAYVLVWSTERSITEHLAWPTLAEDALLDALVHVWRGALGDETA
ncbi:HTH-type transcriptional regulator EthR [Paraconexibacter sp. AEG42_29]|uniref:HTH-type transcriptional regulator EthR n=1 Tax=Paraconexibacter sp. AEG42_29 TaxID=2997339 RepID=A0AAU7B1D8_9ACTN